MPFVGCIFQFTVPCRYFFDLAPAVLNGIHWSQRLDETFRLNLRNDETLRWQYFGSAEGFMRMYPGIKWPTDPEKPDIYDCRLTNWYIRAASSPKDMIILVDISGSMTGIREEIARTTVKEIMNTLHEDDFFNIITVSVFGEPNSCNILRKCCRTHTSGKTSYKRFLQNS